MNEEKLDQLIAEAKSSKELQEKTLKAVESLKNPNNTGTATPDEVAAVVTALQTLSTASKTLETAVAALNE